jgi:hypothetical protein
MATDPWINHDIHRIGRTPPSPPLQFKSEVFKEVKPVKPYPTRERLLELFTLEDGMLKRIKPHHRERADGVVGWINPMRGDRYVRIDSKNCKIERLVSIFKGEE